MRKTRAALAALTTVALLGAVASLGSAHAATSGVGTTEVSTTVVDVQLGDGGAVLGIRLLADHARATIDPKLAAGEALSRMSAVDVTSSTVSALNDSSGAKESKQPGGDADVAVGTLDLSEPGEGVSIDPSVLGGSLALAHLATEAAATQAKATAEATLTSAAMAGGLLSLGGARSTVAGQALSSHSSGVRSVTLEDVVVLDLGALLAGLKIAITDLPLPMAADLLASLEATVRGLAGYQLEAAVRDLQGDINGVQGEIDELEDLAALPGTVQETADALNGAGTTLGVGELLSDDAVADISALASGDQFDAVIDELQAVLDGLTSDLADLLAEIVAALDDLALLKLGTVEVGVETKAADTEGNSVAEVTAEVDGIEVGGKAVPGITLADGLTELDTTLDEINGTVADALDDVDLRLGSLVDVGLFERPAEQGVSSADGYTTAVDGLKAVTVTITPPAELADVVSDVAAAADSLGELLVSTGSTVPTLDGPMAALAGQTNTAGAGALGDGGVITLASVGNRSDFSPRLADLPDDGPGAGGGPSPDGDPGTGGGPGPGTGTGTGIGIGTDGPRSVTALTGATTTIPLTALAMLLIALGLGCRHWVHMPAPRRPRG